MGHYSELFIGNLHLSWKYYIPAFLTFLFEKNDFYIKYEHDPDEYREEYGEDIDEDDNYFEEIGYKTTCKKSICVLQKYGYTLEFFAEIYEFFYSDLYDNYAEIAKEEIAETNQYELDYEQIEELFLKHIESFPRLSRIDELNDFIKFLKSLLQSDFKSPPFDEPKKITLQDGREYLVESKEYLRSNRYRNLLMIDFESLQMYLLGKYLKFPPWIIIICNLFEEGFFFEYPEIMSLMFVSLAMSGVDPDSEIKLELRDIIEDKSEAENLHTNLSNALVEKVNLYNKVFDSLFVNEDKIRDKYIKTQCRELLKLCNDTKNSYEKGRLLERLTEILFTSNNYFELVDKRVSTGDEEIDLVVKNNIDRPFWNALNSPLFFVECKNWKSSVGSKEMRDFEGKLRNHTRLAKVGFFLSINGFTSEVDNELKRGSREEQHIVLLDQKKLEEYLNSNQDFFSWLENQSSKFY